ncbi:DUF3891 family protein [Acidisoma cladoniae]|uniref:DUF3891 family protein n=1 Tax=Acidisoma cladoniae TaxID=3040935 RepID=UPI002551109E|nr:DUF3891 family protein [Acidisoma sp. PAMC 29798]
MMFLDDGASGVLAISQPMHAWIAGELLRHWADRQDDMLVLAAEQHDVAWIDWEVAPSFDAATGRPHLFRAIGAAEHAPLWALGVERALSAWGSRVAMLISRHGTVIYTRFIDRHRLSDADAQAATAYIEQQAPRQAMWQKALGLSAADVERDSSLIAFVDTLSLALCGELTLPMEFVGPGAHGGSATYSMTRDETGCRLTPWPFSVPSLTIKAEARMMPVAGFANENEMRAWLASSDRVGFQVSVSSS